MNNECLRHRKKREDWIPVGRSVGLVHIFFLFNILYGFSEPQRGGWQGRLRSCLLFRMSCFFLRWEVSPASIVLFTVLCCEHVRVDGRIDERMDGRLVGW